jgi:hypothetical protein
MASRTYKDRLLRAVEDLPDEKAAQVVQFAESLRPRKQEKGKGPYRRLGTFRGKIKILPSFFDPLPDDIIDAFEGRGE